MSLADKVKVVNMLGDKLSQTEIATRFEILELQVSRIAKNQYDMTILIENGSALIKMLMLRRH